MPKPLFILAPMDDVTDTVFRRVVADCAAPDMFFTEFVNVDGLQSPGRQKLLKRLLFTPQEAPLIVQIWGKNPENYRKTAEQIANGTFAREMGLKTDVQFAGIDINMGCPDKAVVRNGCCSALIENRQLAAEIIQATQEGAGMLPVSVKTRLGFREVDMTWSEWLLQQKLNMLTIHGRTRVQMSAVPADWDAIGQIREMRDAQKLNTLIIGNGDVLSREQGEALALRYSLDGVMIGRGVFHDPFVFAKSSPWPSYTQEQRMELYRRHITLFAEAWQHGERPVHTLNKFCKTYIQGYDGAKEQREVLMQAHSTDELLQILDDFVGKSNN